VPEGSAGAWAQPDGGRSLQRGGCLHLDEIALGRSSACDLRIFPDLTALAAHSRAVSFCAAPMLVSVRSVALMRTGIGLPSTATGGGAAESWSGAGAPV
jgi:hypothetical protein